LQNSLIGGPLGSGYMFRKILIGCKYRCLAGDRAVATVLAICISVSGLYFYGGRQSLAASFTLQTDWKVEERQLQLSYIRRTKPYWTKYSDSTNEYFISSLGSAKLAPKLRNVYRYLANTTLIKMRLILPATWTTTGQDYDTDSRT